MGRTRKRTLGDTWQLAFVQAATTGIALRPADADSAAMRKLDRIKILVGALAVCAVISHLISAWHSSAQRAALTPPPPPPLPRIHVAEQVGMLRSKGAFDESSSPPDPPPSPSPSPPPEEQPSDECLTREHTEYDGEVVMWGPHNVAESAGACCAACRKHRDAATDGRGCNVWVFCAGADGCASQKFGECWGKRSASNDGRIGLPTVRGSGPELPWVSGMVVTPQEAAAMREEEAAKKRALVERRERPGNPKVYFDVQISYNTPSAADGVPAAAGGRIEFVLYAHESPRAAENFRAMCTGEKGGKLTYTGMRFYRIIDMFIDQAGAGPGAIWGGSFDDDPGGLKLRHERPGLLSAANSGPDSNSGHFSIVVSPAPHLDGGYTVFGEVLSGMDVMMAVNRLDKHAKGNAVVSKAGCLANCAPRPEVKPKCLHREEQERKVQGRPMHPCLD